MKTLKLYLVVSVALLMVLAGCTPNSVPVPTLTPIPPKLAPAESVLSTNSQSTQEATWAKVVEAARKENQLTFYSVTLFSGDAGIAVAKAFKDRYGITVNFLQGRGADWLERLKVERRIGQQVADAIYASVTHMINIRNEGLLEAVPELPMLREKNIWNVDPMGLDSEGYMIGLYVGLYAPGINTKLVKPEEEPKSLNDLLHPRWKDKKIAIADPRVSSQLYLYFVPLVNSKAIDWNFVKQLYKQTPVVVIGGGDLDTGLARGDFPIGIINPDSRLAPLLTEGAPVRQISLKEGDIANPNVFGKVKNGPHPNAARVFMNWMISDEGQELFSKTHGILGVNKRARDWRHPVLQVERTKLLLTTIKDIEDQGRLFQEGFINKLIAEDK